jgi:acyl dehydratase
MYNTGDLISESSCHSLEFTITDKMMRDFAYMSGDTNQIHTDHAYANSKGFDGVLVYGGLIVAQVSRMIGMHMPGENALWNGLKINFMNPLMVEQKAEINANVSHVSKATSSIEINFIVISGDILIAKGSASVSLSLSDNL